LRATTSPSRNRARGYRAERQLVNYLRQRGWAAWRIPTSASSSEPLPDVLAVRASELVAFEVKYRRQKRGSAVVHVDEGQVEKLSRFLEPFALYNRHAVVALRVGRKWIFKPVSGGKVKVSGKEENGWVP
jgi:Holliday junction resolvase